MRVWKGAVPCSTSYFPCVKDNGDSKSTNEISGDFVKSLNHFEFLQKGTMIATFFPDFRESFLRN